MLTKLSCEKDELSHDLQRGLSLVGDELRALGTNLVKGVLSTHLLVERRTASEPNLLTGASLLAQPIGVDPRPGLQYVNFLETLHVNRSKSDFKLESRARTSLELRTARKDRTLKWLETRANPTGLPSEQKWRRQTARASLEFTTMPLRR